jgi:hypothetical protein
MPALGAGISMRGAVCLPDRDRRDEPGDDEARGLQSKQIT